jgi:hypothetical protein
MVLVELLDGEGSWDSKTLVYYSVGLCLKKIYITDPEAKNDLNRMLFPLRSGF